MGKFFSIFIVLVVVQLVHNEPETGYIAGLLSYPAEYLPADIKVCAINLSSNMKYCTTRKNIKGLKYKMKLPVGEYNVYAESKQDNYAPAYYTDAVLCGLTVDCPSHKIITVKVEAGKTTKGVNPGDWYMDLDMKMDSLKKN